MNVLAGTFKQGEKQSFEVEDSTEANYSADARLTIGFADDDLSNIKATTVLQESQGKATELRDELMRITGLLTESESKNMDLKQELFQSRKCLEESIGKQGDLGLKNKILCERISVSEKRHNSELVNLQDALKAQEVKNGLLENMKETLEDLNLELESSRMNVEDLKQDLKVSNNEAWRFEELHMQSSLLAKSETKKALEFERLLEIAKSNAIEMKNQMASLQGELMVLYENIAEKQILEETLNKITGELSGVREEFKHSQIQVQDMERKLASKEALINQLTQGLDFPRESESKAEEDIASLEKSLSSLNASLEEKVSHIDDLNIKLSVQVTIINKMEEQMKDEQMLMKIMQELLVTVDEELQELQDTVSRLTGNIPQRKSLQENLQVLLLKTSQKTDSIAVTNRKELEQKLKIPKVVSIGEYNVQSPISWASGNNKLLQEATSSDSPVGTTEVTLITNLKFILGVTLVSVIIGIMLGKMC